MLVGHLGWPLPWVAIEDQQTETTLPARFRELAESHGIDEAATAYAFLGDDQPAVADSVYCGALATIEKQTADKVAAEIEHLLHQRGAPKDEHDLALVLALFIYGRQAGEGAQIVVDGVVFGDHADQHLTEIRIEPNAKRGDFDIDVLVALREFGPHPERNNGGPDSLTVIKEAALLRKRIGGETYADEGLKRRAMADLGLTAVIYHADEIERDPFALARRVIDDLGRRATDEVYPVGS
jgi:hypothetical protein